MLIASRVIDKHSELSGLGSDDHLQYLHTSTSRIVTACHEFRSNGLSAPIIIKKIIGQTVNLFNVYDESLVLLSYIDKDGNLTATSFTGDLDASNITGTISTSLLPASTVFKDQSNTFSVGNQQITIDDNTKKGLTIKAAALQGVNLLNIIDSSDNALFTVGAGGEALIRSSTLNSVFSVRNSTNVTYFKIDNVNNDSSPLAKLTLYNNTTQRLSLYSDGNGGIIRGDSSLVFNISGTDQVTIASNGNATFNQNITAASLTFSLTGRDNGILYSGLNTGVTGSVANASATKMFLSQTGDESDAGVPVFAQVAVADISGFPSQTSHSGEYLTTNGSVLSWGTVVSYSDPLTTLGDILYRGASATSRLAGNTTTTLKVLTQTGNGSISAAPSWEQLSTSHLSNSANIALLDAANSFTNQNTFAAGTITTSQPFTITQTWNNAGVAFNSLLVNATDTASASASLLMDLQVATVSKFKINKDGSATSIGTFTGTTFIGSVQGSSVRNTTNNTLTIGNTTWSNASGGTSIAIGTNTASNSSGNYILMDLSQTYNQTGTAGSTDLKIVRTETALGSGTHRLIDCYAGAAGTTNVAHISNAGRVTAAGGFYVMAGSGSAYLSGNDVQANYILCNTDDAVIESAWYHCISGHHIAWAASATVGTDTKDTGLIRSSAGVIKVTDGSSGEGKIVAANHYETIVITFDGGGSVLLGPAAVYRQVQSNGTIVGWTLLADQSGSVTIDIKKSTYADFPTTSSITASATPALSSVQKNTDATLTGWTTSITDGDILEFLINGTPASVTKATLLLKVKRA